MQCVLAPFICLTYMSSIGNICAVYQTFGSTYVFTYHISCIRHMLEVDNNCDACLIFCVVGFHFNAHIAGMVAANEIRNIFMLLDNLCCTRLKMCLIFLGRNAQSTPY
jgi:hypothetical protein